MKHLLSSSALDSHTVHLLDTPGFDDTECSDGLTPWGTIDLSTDLYKNHITWRHLSTSHHRQITLGFPLTVVQAVQEDLR